MRFALIWLVLVTACSREEAPPPAPPPPAAKPPIRGVVGDRDLRVMLADVASAKACAMMRGQFRGLRAPDRPGLVTGTLWIRDCKLTNDGTNVKFQLSGNGWQWAKQSKTKAGGTFTVRQYVRFGFHVTMPGAIDIGYDRGDHVVSLWFTPKGKPQVDFKPVGAVEVDRESTWASIIGGLSTVFSDSPEEMAETDAKKQGAKQFESTLADGLAVTIDLCSGLSRFNLGRRPKGKMQPPDVGETKRVPLELETGGMMIAGPQLAERGMTIHAEATEGAVRIALVCAKDAEALAEGFVTGREPGPVPILGQLDVRTKGTLKIKPAKCPVVAVAQAIGPARATFAWLRPPSEIARSTGGPILDCRKDVQHE